MSANVVGKTEVLPLDSVAPNGWNPNRMTPHVYSSLKHGFEKDGWLSSQALLVWATDENNAPKNLIIDGEHRWTVARECGFKSGPMVLLHNVSEAKAKALTVAMNNRRGTFDDQLLADLVRGLDGIDDMALELAIPEADLAKMYALPPIDDTLGVDTAGEGKAKAATDNVAGAEAPPSTVRMVNLFLNETTIVEFTKLVADLGKRYETKNVTDTVLEALRRGAVA